MNKKVIKSTCGLCQAGCGVLIYMEGNSITKIEGDPDSPINRGVLCIKGSASLEYLYHPDRLQYPLKRAGERGSGKWQQISWDEALDVVAGNFIKVKTTYEANRVVFMSGSFKGGFQGAYLARFANAFGSPNIATMASVCYAPRVNGSMLTHGYYPVPDYEYPPGCIVVWGANLAATRIGEYEQTVRALQGGSRLIVIDPRRIDLSDRADIWVQPRPGSDLALALGMINSIINEDLYDKAFVHNWTVGFKELVDHVQKYPPEVVEGITWVKATDIKQAAALYAANKPAIIQLGNAIDHNGNNFQTARAISLLRALTGNLGVPGGELSCSFPGILSSRGSPELDLRDKISKEERDKRLGAKTGLVPRIFSVLPQTIVKAILHGDPYPIHAGFIQGGNMVLTYSNVTQVYRAFKKIDFLAVADMFMTPTAALADIVLPVGTYLEFDNIAAPPYYPVAQVQQKVAHVGDCRSDYEILRDLAHRLDIGEYFWESEKDCLDYILQPAGLTFEEFRHIGVLQGQKEYSKHERDGFATPSGKVELFSSQLNEWGFDPLPTYHEPPETPHSAPELAKEYPLVLTSWKSGAFRHSGGRQIASLRATQPDPFMWIHPDTARTYSIADGDWVDIETKRGHIRQKAHLTEAIDPRVVGVDYAWWFPERGSADLYGWSEANINILTDDKPPYGREMGTPNLRGILCKISPADSGVNGK
ncbi:MAG: molybdopterin-dependent oxidoreductase [Syntrophobacterales bacterium]|nr:MAG: molybdopterin-dependent oxidoreductase [Syntrophobacterales bacterium]